MSLGSRLYRGWVDHARGGAVKNRFRYPVYVAALDLGELDALDRRLRLFSLERPNLFSLRGADYALAEGTTRPSRRPPPAASLETRARELLASGGVTDIDRVVLITQPRVLGHVFNPVSFFIALGVGGEITGAIAEINNTYDQTFAYVLGPRQRAAGERGALYLTAKQFFVSPFIGDDAEYSWRFALDRERLDLRVTVAQRGRPMFAARLAGAGRELGDLALLRAFARLPALPAQIWGRIHWQALRLRLLGLQYRRPL